MGRANITLLDEDRDREFNLVVLYQYFKEVPGDMVDAPEPEHIEIEHVTVESATCLIGGHNAPMKCDRDLAAAVLRQYESEITKEVFLNMEAQRWDVE